MIVGFLAVTLIFGIIGLLCFGKNKEDEPKDGESLGGGCITAQLFG